MFPKENMPRCGACIDTVAMPWTPGNLEQRWTLQSEHGQVASTFSFPFLSLPLSF